MILIAHRGLSSLRPENTLAAVRAALELPVRAIEVDVRVTADAVPVLYHDENFSKLGNLELSSVEKSESRQLLALDAGSWFDKAYALEKIPTLKELLALDFAEKMLMLDVKDGPHEPAFTAEAIAKVIKEAQVAPNYFFASISPTILEALKISFPKVPMLGIARSKEQLYKMLESGHDRIVLWYPLINPDQIAVNELKNFIDDGIAFWAFAVDDLKQAEFLTHHGIEAIITNRPQDLI